MGVIEDGKVEGTLPSNEVFAVQYPGYPSSIPRAIQTLGGTKAITKARASKSNNLELHFRPEDPYSRPILGELCPCNGLLLKIVKTQPSSQNADNSPTTTADKGRSEVEDEAKVSAEIVGRVTEAYRFEGMADYQHVVAVHADVARRKKRNWTEMDKPHFETAGLMDLDQEDVMILPPPSFSAKDTPSNIVLRPTSTASSKKKSEDVVENYMEMNMEPSLAIDFNIKEIPKELNWKEFTPLNSVMHEWLMALSELFEERPIWPKESLVQRLREKDLHFNHQTLKRLLVLVAYYFLGGPYRMFWIQKGYDPRQDAESRMYQRMDLRVPPALRSYCDSHAAKGLKHKWEDLCKFEAFPYKCHISLQLFELVDDYIQEEIKKPSKQPTCTYGTGWFTQHAHDSLKFRVMARFLSVYPQPGAEKLHKAALRYFEKSKKQSALENYQKEAQPTDTDDNVGGNQHETGDIAIDELADDDDQEEEIDAYDALDLAGEDDEFSLHSDAFMEPDSNSRNYLQELFYTFPTTGPGAAKIHDADSSDGEYQILEQDDENYSDDDYE
ncbi:General transcription factor 3C polypeptide 5 [Linum grandiflorum]